MDNELFCIRACLQDDDSEYASDSSDDERRLAKPVFVTKSDRETVLEKEKAELEAAQVKEDEQKRKEAREVRVEYTHGTNSLQGASWIFDDGRSKPNQKFVCKSGG